jgi:hypothetical protein
VREVFVVRRAFGAHPKALKGRFGFAGGGANPRKAGPRVPSRPSVLLWNLEPRKVAWLRPGSFCEPGCGAAAL